MPDSRTPSLPRRRAARRAARSAVCAAGALVLVLGGTVPASAASVLAVNDVATVIAGTRNWLVGILAGLATLFLTVGGVRYLMAGGDPGEVEKAKGALKAAAIGYALAVLAPVLLTVLQGIVGAPAPAEQPAPGPTQLPAVQLEALPAPGARPAAGP